MKKILPYILILIMIMGIEFFSPINKAKAEDLPTDLGTCTYNFEGADQTRPSTRAQCETISGAKFVKNAIQCKYPNTLENGACVPPLPPPKVGDGFCTYRQRTEYGTGSETVTIRSTKANCDIVKGDFKRDPDAECGSSMVLENGKCVAQPKTIDPNYILLAPLPGIGGTFNPVSENNSALGTYLNAIITLFIGICAILAVIMIVMGGIEYMTTELVSSKEAGKERIRNAIFGLILALGAWTLLNTINPDLLNSDLKSLKNVEVVVILENDSIPQTAGGTDGKTYPNSLYKKGDTWDDKIGAIQTFDSTKVTKNYPTECSIVGQTSCLSTRNLNLSNLNEVIAKCPKALPLRLNGGTEFWGHGGASGKTTHSPNSPTIDLQSSPELNTCLLGGQPPKPNTMYGGKYYYEVNHWHVGLGK